jgi:predicted O-methyltransferase YrrM
MIDAARLRDIKAISMLSEDVLAKLVECAAQSRAGILEIGPYIGGSTVALAMGNQGRVPHVAIEMGGAYLEHPTLPSADILVDVDANLRRFGVRDRVTIVPGSSHEPSVRRDALALAPQIDLLFVDADGHLPGIVAGFGASLADDCILVFDDYTAPGAPTKEALVREAVARWIRRGAIEEYAIIDSTWFGVIRNKAAMLRRDPEPEQGHAFILYGVDGSRVLENGIDLGPGESLHDDIRDRGGGRFSFFPAVDPLLRERVPALYFSTSDNTDPRTNSRRYEVV